MCTHGNSYSASFKSCPHCRAFIYNFIGAWLRPSHSRYFINWIQMYASLEGLPIFDVLRTTLCHTVLSTGPSDTRQAPVYEVTSTPSGTCRIKVPHMYPYDVFDRSTTLSGRGYGLPLYSTHDKLDKYIIQLWKMTP